MAEIGQMGLFFKTLGTENHERVTFLTHSSLDQRQNLEAFLATKSTFVVTLLVTFPGVVGSMLFSDRLFVPLLGLLLLIL